MPPGPGIRMLICVPERTSMSHGGARAHPAALTFTYEFILCVHHQVEGMRSYHVGGMDGVVQSNTLCLYLLCH